MNTQTQIILVRAPAGPLQAEHFGAVQAPLAEPTTGELLVRALYISLDPYLRKAMNGNAASHAGIAPGDVMKSRVVGRVLHSRDAGFQQGDLVLGVGNWSEHGLLAAKTATRLDEAGFAPSVYLGVVGQSGFTAWGGMTQICQPQPGQTVVVSSAAGAVGSVAGQLARLAGCRVVGIAGGPDKCAHVMRKMRFDTCVDYHLPDFEARLAEATPDGIDACFENVGARILDATLGRLNRHARIALCGLLGHYEDTGTYAFKNFDALLSKGILLQGFSVGDFEPLRGRAMGELAQLVASGDLAYDETVADGLLNAPRAMVEMLRGGGLGKHVVKVG